MRKMLKISHIVRNTLVCLLLPVLLMACSDKQSMETGNSATLKVTMDLSAFSSQRSGPAARKITNNTGQTFDQIIISVLTEKNVPLISGDILATGGNLALIVPANTTLIVRGEALIEGALQFAGETVVQPIPAGGNAATSFTMYSTSSESGVLQIDIGIGGKPGEGKSGGGIFSKNNFVIYDSSKTLPGSSDIAPSNVYLSNTVTQETISLYETEAETAQDPFYLDADMSADGQYVVFSTLQSLLPADEDNARDVYLRDTRSQALMLLSSSDEGATTFSYSPSISDNGSTIVFTEEYSVEGGGTEKLIEVYDRLAATITKRITAAHSAKISGDGKKLLFKLSDKNQLSLMGNDESVPLVLVGSETEDLPLADYALNFDGSKVLFSLSEDFGDLLANHVYVVDVAKLEQQTVSVDQNGVLLTALSDFHLTFSIDDKGRFVAFNYNRNIYVRDLENNETQVLASGEQPFISPDGFDIGFTYKNSIYSKRNPFLEDIERPGNAPVATVELNSTQSSSSVLLNWQISADADYYRVYASTQKDMEARAFSNTQSWETTDLAQEILFSNFEFTAENPNLYYQVAIVNDNGVFTITDEQDVQVFVPPVTTSKSGLYKFQIALDSVSPVEAAGVCPALEVLVIPDELKRPSLLITDET
ncbi:MAG: hypothetical protein R3240_00555, partial [Gammaproteobacteria bacterium]|nr:hypothetical protein [Gammaproteobacteria bacterium]